MILGMEIESVPGFWDTSFIGYCEGCSVMGGNNEYFAWK